MFGIRLTTKRELTLLAATISDLRAEIARLNVQLEHERKRAEGAINALLIKCTKMAITTDHESTIEEQEKFKERQLNIFGDDEPVSEAEALEKLQS